MYSAARDAGGSFIQGLANMLFKQGKVQSADTLSRAVGAVGSRNPISPEGIARQAPVPGMPSRAGLIGTRDAVVDTGRRAPVPEFGTPPAGQQIPEALRIAIGEGASPVVRGPNAAVADAIQESSPDLAAVIRANDALEAGPNPGAFYQPGLGLRFPAGARNLAETTSTRGRTTPAGTKIGGRPYTPESMASPRNVETTRLANVPRQADAPDAPARIPGGQGEIDLRSNPELLMGQAYRTAPSVSPVAGSAADVMPRMGVQMTDLGAMLRNLSPEDRIAMGIGGSLIGISTAAGVADQFGGGKTGEEAVLEVESQPNTVTIVDPSVTPLAPPDGLAQTPVVPEGMQPMDAQAVQSRMTPDENAALREQTSRTSTALQQSDPVAGSIAKAFAPRDPSYYTPERGGIGQYYEDRRRYVQAMTSGELQDMADAIKMAAESQQQSDSLDQWAKANPALAYELINRASMRNPGQNQQSGQQVTSQALGSSLGTDNAANVHHACGVM